MAALSQGKVDTYLKVGIADNIRRGTYLFYRPYQQCYANVVVYRASVFSYKYNNCIIGSAILMASHKIAILIFKWCVLQRVLYYHIFCHNISYKLINSFCVQKNPFKKCNVHNCN